jgi:predicted GNAT superfamily acetyltransferase
MSETPITVRACHSVAEFEQMVDLQVRVWQYSERDLVPAIMFVVAAKTGGQVMGAFDGEFMVGFALAYAGIMDGQPYLHSHMAAVLPDYRDRGVGRELKLAQRADALTRGIQRIEWTFDPLQLKNAYFNICRLGVTVRRYLPNLYGQTSSPLHAGLPTDRLLAEWHLDSERVTNVLAGKKPHVGTELQRVHVANPNGATKSELAGVQARMRERFQMLFAEGYAVTWLERESDGASYVTERQA